MKPKTDDLWIWYSDSDTSNKVWNCRTCLDKWDIGTPSILFLILMTQIFIIMFVNNNFWDISEKQVYMYNN